MKTAFISLLFSLSRLIDHFSFLVAFNFPQLMRFLPDKSSMISCGWKASSRYTILMLAHHHQDGLGRLKQAKKSFPEDGSHCRSGCMSLLRDSPTLTHRPLENISLGWIYLGNINKKKEIVNETRSLEIQKIRFQLHKP